ncbi:MAG TPA: sugar transferase [Caulobacteraceae bacterium]|jgi:putative colanic acid biosynthesis UDP-glucose lipid carrier transferase
MTLLTAASPSQAVLGATPSRVCPAAVASPRSEAAAAQSQRKRAFDLVAAALALLLFLPLLCLIAAAIRLESGGPVLFRQARTGLGGEPFRIFKFRTMRVAEDGPTVTQATRGDARVTPLGAVLRKLSLDELPQLLNVLRGEMSFVGPRPHAVSHDLQWAAALTSYSGRFRARPGLTGLAQVQGLRGEITSPEALKARVDADIAYIETWSFVGDLKLILRTVPLLFGDARAF